MAEKPVVFLAFANDHHEQNRYLRNLPEEARALRTILEGAAGNGLCEVVLRPNVTADEVFEVFRQHPNRVAIFHYGGHADSNVLHLEAQEKTGQAAYAAGLAAFLSLQQGLQLVFLNGCSTQAQVDGLHAANVPAVVATTNKVKDDVATNFAAAFYKALAEAANLRKAFLTAQSEIQTTAGGTRNLVMDWAVQDAGSVDPDWPWLLNIKPGAEEVERWNLPQQVNNPLFGLPEPKIEWLPPSPYRRLEPFTLDHAAIFFGRNREIRELYDLVTSPDAPVILYYGQAGVGKSSVLEAGLFPRLAASHQVACTCRDPRVGLLGTLRNQLAPESSPEDFDLLHHWRQRESPNTGESRPLVLVLDQAEQAFTQDPAPAPAINMDPSREVQELMGALQRAFADPSHRPRGKLILSFRKEWLDDFIRPVEAARLRYVKKGLDSLNPSSLL